MLDYDKWAARVYLMLCIIALLVLILGSFGIGPGIVIR